LEETAATKTASAWLAKLNAALDAQDASAAAALFAEECYWRDLIALTWNIRTFEGRDAIAAMLQSAIPAIGPRNFTITGKVQETDRFIEAWFAFETTQARGVGHLRLKGGLGFTILTTMTELKGHEERKGPSREHGVVHGAIRDRETWLARKTADEEELGHSRQPYCVIIGGGQGGIALGARLKRLGVPTIILEKNERAGDSWRNRYQSLVLHDPVWYDHLPYMPFPEHWPVFTPKDKMGDWLESYAKVMELNYWASSECAKAAYDPASKEWTIAVDRGGKILTVKPKQLVFATGSYGPPREIRLPGQNTFRGEFCHSSRYHSGRPYRGKKCVVIGSNSSAHDICADLWEHGADVTMLQRSPTTVVRSETMMEVAFASLYSEEAVAKGIDVNKADLIFASVPFRLMAGVQKPFYDQIKARDADLIARLNKVGFETDYGVDESGLMMKALRTGSGYYLDVGASELIANGEIKLRPKVEPVSFKEHSIVLSDGSELPADLVVAATGYLPMNEWVARIVSREAADLIGPNWGYGSGTQGDPGPWEGELRNMWKPLKHEAMWFHGGNLHLSRHYSLYVALQIKARMEGVPTPVY
jgi:putative flavoprotein involved in K+ transport